MGMPERDDWIYLAGMIDGEGCITIMSRGQDQAPVAAVIVVNTDTRLMAWLKSTFGGNVRRQAKAVGKHKQAWQWRILARQAETVLVEIRPFLKLKGDQTDVALAYRSLKRPELKSLIRVLNRKGVEELLG
jgi:hypothetical protein